MRVQIVESQFQSINAFRGIGAYSAFLQQYLARLSDIQLVQEQPDIIHYPFFDLFFHTLPLKKAAPMVVTIHDVIPLVFPKQYKPGIKGGFRFLQQLVSLQRIDAVLTDSNCSKKDIMQYLKLPQERVHVVYLAGNPNIVTQPDAVVRRIRKKYVLPERYVLYVGDINYNKNLPGFIRACMALPEDMHVVMVGRTLKNREIPEGLALHNTIQVSGLEKRVHLFTEIPGSPTEDLAAITTAAQMYVQPSFYEGFGLPVLDAMQCGVPVVCSNSSSLPEVAGTAAIYVDPNNFADISRGMQKVLKLSPKERIAIREAGFTQAKKFRWEQTAKETEEVYNGVLSKRSV